MKLPFAILDFLQRGAIKTPNWTEGRSRTEAKGVKVENTGVYAATPVRAFRHDFAVLSHGQAF